MKHTTNAPRRRLIAAVLAIALVSTIAAPAGAIELPVIDGILRDGGGGGGTASVPPPEGGVAVEGETLTGGTVHTAESASDGEYLRTFDTSAAPGLAAGHHEVTVRVRGASTTRLRITVDGVTVGASTVGTAWTEVRAVALAADDATIGVVAEPLPGNEVRAVDLDWLHAVGHEPVFTVAGNQILDPGGAPVVPRGVTSPGYQAPKNIDGRLVLPPSFATEQHAWGITVVRLPLNQEHWLADCASNKHGALLSYRAAVADEVQRLTERGVMAILTLTRTERGAATGCAEAGLPVFKEMADQRSPTFWRSVATTFADNPLVAFDLFNEPHKISDAIWRNGGTVTYTKNKTQMSYEAVGMQGLLQAVRSTGADNLVLVSGNRWASDPRTVLSQPLNGYGIVMAAHSYCHGCSPPQLHPHLDTFISEALTARHPVMISETGWIDSSTSSYSRLLIDWATDRGLGWTMYGWGHPNANYTVLDSWVPASFDAGGGAMTFHPSPAGAPVWNDLVDVRVSRGFEANLLAEDG